jgi:hypothetical protein
MQKKINILLLLLIVFFLRACKTSEYPVNQPYAYKTKINIAGKYKESEKKYLLEKLEKQIDDSLGFTRKKIKRLNFIPGYIKQYHTLDSNSINRTYDFFKAAYVANGYFRGGISTSKIEIYENDPYARIVNFTVFPFLNHKLDTIIYQLRDSSLEALNNEIKANSLLHKNDFYAQDVLDAERRRIVTHFRNNGYYKITKEDFKVVADTINLALLKIADDPFEQQLLFEKAALFNETPTTDITIALKENTAPEKLRKYYVGKIIINPDNINEDVTPPYNQNIENGKITKQYFTDNFKNKLFLENTYLKKGAVFSQKNSDKTIEAYTNLGPWQQIIIGSIDSSVRADTIDFKINMLPYKRYRSERKIEGSYNQNNSNNNITANLLGVNISQSVKDRNFARQAIQTNTSIIASAEFGQKSIVNTLQAGLNFSMIFPKFVPKISSAVPPVFKKPNYKEKPSSFINFSANYSKRIQFFELADIGVSYGLQWKGRWNWNYQLTPINIENKVLDKLDSLKRVLDRNPNLAFIYNDGLIFGPKFNWNRSRILKDNSVKKESINTSIRYALEISYPFGKGISKTLNNNLFSFAKFEIDKRYNFIRHKTTWALRGFLGIGKSYFESLPQNKHLPFYRQFIGGGPNSMRAWTIRSLNSYSTRTSSAEQTDFFGDIQAECNIEFRYQYGKVLGIPILGALYTDIGNIWNFTALEKTQVPYNLSSIQRIWNDLGVAGGTSVRIDFEYFLIRFDLGMKLKQPLDIGNQGGWFTRENFKLSFNHLSPIKLQLGINYPF